MAALTSEQLQQLIDGASLDTLRDMYQVDTDLVYMLEEQIKKAKIRRQAFIIEIDKRTRAAERMEKAKVVEGEEGEVGYEGRR